MAYDYRTIEKKWQKFWDDNETYKVDTHDFSKPKYYALDMFPYPSGVGLHAGHPEGYTATDIISRMKRMQGYNVLHPMGFDSFGLPAENYAIKTGTHPWETTKKNIDTFRRQIQIIERIPLAHGCLTADLNGRILCGTLVSRVDGPVLMGVSCLVPGVVSKGGPAAFDVCGQEILLAVFVQRQEHRCDPACADLLDHAVHRFPGDGILPVKIKAPDGKFIAGQSGVAHKIPP